MSSTPSISIGKSHNLMALAMLVAAIFPLKAQENGRPGQQDSRASRSEREVIDILAPQPRGELDQRLIEQCEQERDGATISREIVVCREILQNGAYRYSDDRDEAQRRYAEETAFANDPQAPDVAGPGIFRGPATVGSLCIPGLQRCPPPPALMIDVTKLPQAPPGSDADRIARGLPPLGNDEGDGLTAQERLGLPPPLLPVEAGEGEGVSQEESAIPTAGQ